MYNELSSPTVCRHLPLLLLLEWNTTLLVYRESTSFQDRLRRFFRFPVDSEYRENGEPFPLPPAMDIAIRKRLTIRERIIDPRYENSPLSLPHPEKHDRVGIELRANSKRFFERILLTRSLNRFARERERERGSRKSWTKGN